MPFYYGTNKLMSSNEKPACNLKSVSWLAFIALLKNTLTSAEYLADVFYYRGLYFNYISHFGTWIIEVFEVILCHFKKVKYVFTEKNRHLHLQTFLYAVFDDVSYLYLHFVDAVFVETFCRINRKRNWPWCIGRIFCLLHFHACSNGLATGYIAGFAYDFR